MKPKDIKNLQIGKTLQRVAVGESLTVTTADGSVVIAKAVTPIKNADVAFQKIADGTWVAFDFKQDQTTSRNEKIDIRRTKPTIRETVTSPQYKVKGLVKFTDNKVYKGGDGVIVSLDQSIDTLVKFFSTGSGSLDYLAYWRKGDDLVFDAAGQKTIIPAWFASQYYYDNVIDGPVYFTYEIEMPRDYYVNTTVTGFPRSNYNDSFQRAYPVYYTILGEIFEAVATQNYSIVQTSTSVLANLEISWTMNIVLPGIPPLINSCIYTETKTGSASATTAVISLEVEVNTQFKRPVWIADNFVIVQEQNIQHQTTEVRNGYRANSGRWLLTNMTTYINTNSLFWSFPDQTDIQRPGTNTYTFINTNTLDATTIDTNSLLFYFRTEGSNMLSGTNIGDTLNITYEDWLIRVGITDISVADIINEEQYHAFPYIAGETFKYHVPTEATITEIPFPGTDFEDTRTAQQYSATTSYNNTAFTVFWDSMQGKVFDIYYKEAGTCYILEAALSFNYIDYDWGAWKERFLISITGTVTAKRECNGGIAKEVLENLGYPGYRYYDAVAISQANYWNYIWATLSTTYYAAGDITIWYIFSRMNLFLKDNQLRGTFTQPPSKEQITQEHTSYTELFALLPDGRFVRLGEEASPVSAMALGTPNDLGFWSYYSQ